MSDSRRFISGTLMDRYMRNQRLERGAIELETMLPQVEIDPKKPLSPERAMAILKNHFICQDEVVTAMNKVMAKIMPGFTLASQEMCDIPFTEEQAAYLADDRWVLMYLPVMPLLTIVQMVKAGEMKDDVREKFVRAIGFSLSRSKDSGIAQLLGDVLPIGLGGRMSAGYVFVSTEGLTSLRKGVEASDMFEVKQLGWIQLWTLLILEQLLNHQLIRQCAYEHVRVTPDGLLVADGQPDSPATSFGEDFLGLASPKSISVAS